ncbi:GPI-anchored protein LLG1-like [Phragmites australis]|uniref:GPI-anchored protein LLG1-like n=1 Tax=Phragmites australis TaxID=29695 RepID=UPI002D79C59B|nr:GPI-anchored protein LLG1-like [Phragmites australis]
MAADRGLLLLLLSAAALAGLASASAPFISDGALQASAGSTGRRLLQALKPCPVNFELQNYTGLVSRCKGPKYPAKECCDAFKEFACPYSEYINDVSNSCATTMFSYINIYGKYPPGLFSSECHGDKNGLSCEGVPQQGTTSGGEQAQTSLLAFISIMFGLVALLFH